MSARRSSRSSQPSESGCLVTCCKKLRKGEFTCLTDLVKSSRFNTVVGLTFQIATQSASIIALYEFILFYIACYNPELVSDAITDLKGPLNTTNTTNTTTATARLLQATVPSPTGEMNIGDILPSWYMHWIVGGLVFTALLNFFDAISLFFQLHAVCDDSSGGTDMASVGKWRDWYTGKLKPSVLSVKKNWLTLTTALEPAMMICLQMWSAQKMYQAVGSSNMSALAFKMAADNAFPGKSEVAKIRAAKTLLRSRMQGSASSGFGALVSSAQQWFDQKVNEIHVIDRTIVRQRRYTVALEKASDIYGSFYGPAMFVLICGKMNTIVDAFTGIITDMVRDQAQAHIGSADMSEEQKERMAPILKAIQTVAPVLAKTGALKHLPKGIQEDLFDLRDFHGDHLLDRDDMPEGLDDDEDSYDEDEESGSGTELRRLQGGSDTE